MEKKTFKKHSAITILLFITWLIVISLTIILKINHNLTTQIGWLLLTANGICLIAFFYSLLRYYIIPAFCKKR